MPNVTINILKMKDIGKKDWFVSGVDTCRDGSERPYCYFDFNNIVPEPKTEEECPNDCNTNITPDNSIQKDKEKPWFNWYKWRYEHWGTKWNGFDCEIINDDAIKFETAWSPADSVMEELSRTYYKDRVMLLFYNDEFDYNWYVNEYRNGSFTSTCLGDVISIPRSPDNGYSEVLENLEKEYLKHKTNEAFGLSSVKPLDDIWCYYRSQNELIHVQECDSEENTVEYSIYPVTRLGDLDITETEHIYANLIEPRDGGWFTFESNDIHELSREDITNAIIGFAYNLKDGEKVEVYFIDDPNIT